MLGDLFYWITRKNDSDSHDSHNHDSHKQTEYDAICQHVMCI